MFGVRDSFGEQRADVLVMEFVSDAATLPLADDEPEVAEHSELLRYRRALHFDGP